MKQKRKLSNWEKKPKKQNTLHHKNKSMAAERVPFYYCQRVSSVCFFGTPPAVLTLLPYNPSQDAHPCSLHEASLTF